MTMEHLNEACFIEGTKAFYVGEMIPATLTDQQRQLVTRRLRAIIKGDKKTARFLNWKLISNGYKLTDTDTEEEVFTTVEVRSFATCPYPANTIEASEWERGYNHAYFANQRKHKHVSGISSNARYRVRRPRPAHA